MILMQEEDGTFLKKRLKQKKKWYGLMNTLQKKDL